MIDLFCCTNINCNLSDDCIHTAVNKTEFDFIHWSEYKFIEPESIQYCRYFLSRDKLNYQYEKTKSISC